MGDWGVLELPCLPGCSHPSSPYLQKPGMCQVLHYASWGQTWSPSSLFWSMRGTERKGSYVTESLWCVGHSAEGLTGASHSEAQRVYISHPRSHGKR